MTKWIACASIGLLTACAPRYYERAPLDPVKSVNAGIEDTTYGWLGEQCVNVVRLKGSPVQRVFVLPRELCIESDTRGAAIASVPPPRPAPPPTPPPAP